MAKTIGDRARLEQEIRTRWFNNHQPTHYIHHHSDGTKSERLIWRQEGTVHYYVEYLRVGNRLIVTGDIGDAIYWWSDKNDLHWVSQLDLSYFASKCTASEVGRLFHGWDEHKALRRVLELIAEEEERRQEDGDGTEIGLRDEFTKRGGYEAIYSRDAWCAWCPDNAAAVFGEYWFESVGAVGECIHMRCAGHLLGLKMAFEQIEGNPMDAAKDGDAKPPFVKRTWARIRKFVEEL